MTNNQSYVICTSPRSGSTLLCRLLGATGVAGKPGSHFHEPSISAWLDYYGLTDKAGDNDRHVLKRIFDAARAHGTAGTDVFGLRLQRHSFDFFVKQLDVLHPGLASDRARFEAAFGRTFFIHLTRPDKLDQAVSYIKASQTGLWHQAPDGTELERLAPPQKPVYDAAKITRQIAEFEAFDEAWDAWFSKEHIEPLRLTYDGLSADPNGTLANVLDRLGLDRRIAANIHPGIAKLADATNREWVSLYLAETDRGR